MNAVDEYVAALQARDWARMGKTLTEDIQREGPEGAESDAIQGLAGYLKWSADLLDPLYAFSWTPTLTFKDPTGRYALVEAESRYEPKKGDTPFGYRLAVVFRLNAAGLIEHVSYYWKTPRQRLAWDTVEGHAQAGKA
ncbi:MAG: nuclear transport factor 2 family protein [Pseudomonadota bacterium]